MNKNKTPLWLGFCLFLLTGMQPIFADDAFPEDKSLSSKAKTLSRRAIAELAKNNQEASQYATELLEQVTEDASFRRLDIDTQVLIFTNLSTAYQRCARFKEQDKLITGLLDDTNCSRFWVELKVHLARSLVSQGRIQEAELLFQQLLREPKRKLAHHETKEIISLASCFERYYQDLLAQAENLYNAKLYSESALLYRIVFTASEHHRFPQTRSPVCRKRFMGPLCYRLASCYYRAGDYENCIHIAGSYAYYLPEQLLRLYAMSCKKEGRYLEALQGWNKVLEVCPDDQMAKNEACISAIKTHQFDIARKLLDPQSGKLQILLAIETQNYQAADSALQKALATLNATDLDYYECLFLQGYLCFKQGNFSQAALNLEQSIVKSAEWSQAEWSQDARYLLANAYLFLASQSPKLEEEAFFDRAESCFEEMLREAKSGTRQRAASLGLVKTLLARYEKTKTRLFLDKAKSFIEKQPPDKSYELMLLVAKSTNGLKALVSPEYEHEPLYPQALFYYAESCTSPEAKRHFLKKAFLARPVVHSGTENCTKAIIEALASVDAKLTLELLSPLDPKEKEDALYQYLTCFALSHIPENETSFFEKSQSFIQENKNLPLFSKLTLKLTLRQALVHWKNERYAACYETLCSLGPDFEERDTALFFSARCCEKLHRDAMHIDAKALYQELYTVYPHSWYAPESYFRFFAEQEYMQGNAEAILHLKRMPEAFTHSPFCAIGHFYIAESLRLYRALPQSASEASMHYEKAIEYATCDVQNQAMLDTLALMTLHAGFGNAYTHTLSATTPDEQRKSLAELQLLLPKLQERGLHALWQECSWQSVCLLTTLGEKAKAREELHSLLEYARQSECMTTEPVLFATCELARQHMQAKEFSTAEELLAAAEKIHENGKQRELLLTVWLTQSELMRQMQNYDAAMMLLAKVINDFSATSLRIQAMYKRAELYELKGRPDLAIRQLEACAKKGGEWAETANKRLKERYGFK